jgi:2,4-dienoyl-CoA reductase-like NADH-dependent reductase (Old Yellow Enzyme family)
MVTGGIAPNLAGWLKPFGGKLSWPWEIHKHRIVTKAVHDAGGRIAMQILHAGRYGYHPLRCPPPVCRRRSIPSSRASSPPGAWSARSRPSSTARCWRARRATTASK